MRTLALAVALVAFTFACRSAPKTRTAGPAVPTVADADLGRLAPAQMGPIQAARAQLDEARDAIARARLRLQDSRHEGEWANAEKAAAEGDRLRAAAELSSAREAGDQRHTALAMNQAEAAAFRAQAAAARLDYAGKLLKARGAEVRTAEAHVRRAEWELERAKLTALQQAQLPAASKYNPAPIQRMIAEATKAEDGARAQSRELSQIARAAYDKWHSLSQRYEAKARSIPTG